MILTHANALAYLALGVGIGLILGSVMLAFVASTLLSLTRDVLLILGQPDILQEDRP